MLKISNNLAGIQKQFNIIDPLANIFNINAIKEKVVPKFPKDLVIKKKNIHETLSDRAFNINMKYTYESNKIYREIVALLLTKEMNETFEERFNAWIKTTVGKEHYERVEKSIKIMAETHVRYDEDLTYALQEIKEERAVVKKFSNLGNESLRKLIETNDVGEKYKLIEDFVSKIIQIEMHQSELFIQYRQVKKVLETYNERRIEWAEFLCGFRPTCPKVPCPEGEFEPWD